MAEPPKASRKPEDKSSGAAARQESNVGHKLVTALGIAIILASIGILLFDALTGEDRPPEIVLHVEKIEPQASGNFLVLFRAENRGSTTAADLSVTGELQDSSGPGETSEAQLDYVPAHSERRGGLFFKSDPRQAKLELHATGFQEP